MRAFEDRFMTIGLPYRVIGGPRFYERAEIRDAMAYFRAAVSRDDGLALQRIINKPKAWYWRESTAKIKYRSASREITFLYSTQQDLYAKKIELTGRAQKELKILIGTTRSLASNVIRSKL